MEEEARSTSQAQEKKDEGSLQINYSPLNLSNHLLSSERRRSMNDTFSTHNLPNSSRHFTASRIPTSGYVPADMRHASFQLPFRKVTTVLD
ncbi:hypothetical protein EJ02DRAFT_450093 [Clathrospora elynae]|uniref:Uncharacterized protein n=1 Tax=Clathrospora elynae TaxID=706981 RepID=A0A6A5T8P4_9PLEO|nr:hypothetical protein EJ02DRAFT_450093 [Clathrospora elynae]